MHPIEKQKLTPVNVIMTTAESNYLTHKYQLSSFVLQIVKIHSMTYVYCHMGQSRTWVSLKYGGTSVNHVHGSVWETYTEEATTASFSLNVTSTCHRKQTLKMAVLLT